MFLVTMNRTRFVATLVVALFVFSYSRAEEDWGALIRQQFIEYHAGQPVDDAEIQKSIELQGPNGAWMDIDYTDTRRGDWEVREHMTRTVALASAYVNPKSRFFKTPETQTAVRGALRNWLDKDYQNANWWYARIGIPEPFLKVFLLMGTDLDAQILLDARPIIDRSSMGMTGQNKVWCAGIALMKGVVYEEPELMKAASAAIWSELRITTKEGIQPDWSFHQHGPQLQFGNYGLWFGKSIVLWASTLRDTPYSLGGAQLETFRGYVLNGPSWVLWNGFFDLGACARQIDRACQVVKGAFLQNQLQNMIAVDPAFADEYRKRLATPNQLVGFQAYPQSDFAVQRRPDWYASLKMSSSRLIGAENTNSENSLGLHLSDGMLLLTRRGQEYEDIQPLWDWKRLPGTTCDQGLNDLRPLKGMDGVGRSNFVGVLGGERGGMATMIYKRESLKAHKAWFFEDHAVICLGSGINGRTEGSVLTSVQQSWLEGPMVSSSGTIKDGTKPLKAGAWVHHAGIGYHLLVDSVLSAEEVSGNWNPIFPTRGNRPVSGKVFSLWIDHGKSPEEGTYAYLIYPQVEADQMKHLVQPETTIISNTTKLQAVEGDVGVMAVFYEPGTFRDGSGREITASAACMLNCSEDGLFVADPTQRLKELTVSVDGEAYVVKLPTHKAAGQPVKIKYR